MNDAYIITWLCILSLGQMLTVLYILWDRPRMRRMIHHVDEQVAQIDIVTRMDRVIELATTDALTRSKDLRIQVSKLIEALKEQDSALLQERHWTAIHLIEQHLKSR